MALLQTQTITQAGLAPSLQAASVGGDQYYPTSSTFLYVKNGSGAPITVTVATTATIFGQPISNVAVSVPAAGEEMLGPYDPGMVAQPVTNLANVTYSAVASLSIAAISCPPA